MMEHLRNSWHYWWHCGHSLSRSHQLAQATFDPSPTTKPRKKRGFFIARFHAFWTKP